MLDRSMTAVRPSAFGCVLFACALLSGCAARGVVLDLALPVRSSSITIEVRNVDGLPPVYQATLGTTGLDDVEVFIPYPDEGTPSLPWVVNVIDGTGSTSLERCLRSSDPVRDALTLVPWDADEDGFRNRPRRDCADELLDCNDDDATVFPGSEFEVLVCGLTDADCDGVIAACPDADGDGHVRCAGAARTGCDCHDGNPLRHPGAEDVCENGIDEDCDGIDASCDHDGDGYPPPDDCRDADPDVHPFAEERCNLLDDDCDGAVDEGATCVEVDRDGDGYLACVGEEPSCDPNDCDAAVHPGAFDQCGDGVDADGDGVDACPSTDQDGDGYVDLRLGGSDCNDFDPQSHPLAPDRCEDGIAQDCIADRSCAMDVDGDGWIEPAACEDGFASPDRAEICNARDDDCDGRVDEILSATSEAWPQGVAGCTTDPRPRDFTSDVEDCGGCGIRCELPLERCVGGACVSR